MKTNVYQLKKNYLLLVSNNKIIMKVFTSTREQGKDRNLGSSYANKQNWNH